MKFRFFYATEKGFDSVDFECTSVPAALRFVCDNYGAETGNPFRITSHPVFAPVFEKCHVPDVFPMRFIVSQIKPDSLYLCGIIYANCILWDVKNGVYL